ncbi:hypothetical protein, partial [Klebsiella pneumoniae]|uniref:hypothetical protein n=1 Tax=Klebsiella pneumoniae TaxID=573 RepID=UPI001CDB8512
MQIRGKLQPYPVTLPIICCFISNRLKNAPATMIFNNHDPQRRSRAHFTEADNEHQTIVTGAAAENQRAGRADCPDS